MKKNILLHCCCGPCSTASIERLLGEDWNVTLFYQNSNIYPQEENDKRFENLQIVARHYGLPLLRSLYNHEDWLEHIKGLENEPECGKRCLKCFEYNLSTAANKAKQLEIEHFTTTLSVSRFKKSLDIFNVGAKFENFEPIDFKKKDGFSKSIILSKELNLYRQTYCGCEFSKGMGRVGRIVQ